MATDASTASVKTVKILGFVYSRIGNRETVSVLGYRFYDRLGYLSVVNLPRLVYKTVGSFWVVVTLGICVLKYQGFIYIPGGVR